MEKGETKINQTKEWIEGKLAEIDSLGPVGDDMKTIAQQKAKLKVWMTSSLTRRSRICLFTMCCSALSCNLSSFGTILDSNFF